MTKTMSVCMERQNYEFLAATGKEERSDLSKALHNLVTRGRFVLAVEKYKKGRGLSLGEGTKAAGLPIGQMMMALGSFGFRSKIERDDYRQSLPNLTKIW